MKKLMARRFSLAKIRRLKMFKKAVKRESKLLLAINGPSGSGKTYTALSIASKLAKFVGGDVALVDTEHGSASKYADLWDFDTMQLSAPYNPERFSKAAKDAVAAGYKILIIDSLSHAWAGAGGALEMVDQEVAKSQSGNSYTAWGKVTPIYRRMIEDILGTGIHVIVTMRSKTAHVLEEREGKGGRTYNVPVSIGMQPVIREGTEYEFDVVLDMDLTHTAHINKTRCPALDGAVIETPGKEVVDIIWNWLQGEPARSKDAVITSAKFMETSQDWAEEVFNLEAVNRAFEKPERVHDWRMYVTAETSDGDEVNTMDNALILPLLLNYCESVNAGAAIGKAANTAYNEWMTFQAKPAPDGKGFGEKKTAVSVTPEPRKEKVIIGVPGNVSTAVYDKLLAEAPAPAPVAEITAPETSEEAEELPARSLGEMLNAGDIVKGAALLGVPKEDVQEKLLALFGEEASYEAFKALAEEEE